MNISSKQNDKKAKNNFVLGIKADLHYSSNNHTRCDGVLFPDTKKEDIKFFDPENGIVVDAVCDLGDIARGYEFDPPNITKKDYNDIINLYADNLTCPLFFVAGNHDNGVLWTVNNIEGSGNFDMNELYMPSERYGIVMNKMKLLSNICDVKDKLYYYCDLERVRIVVLDTNDYPNKNISVDDIDINHHALSNEQIKWLSNEALKTDLPIIILSHCPLCGELMPNSKLPDNCGEAVKIIEEYNRAAENVVAVLSGHTHKFFYAVQNGINHITFPDGAENSEIFDVSFNTRKIKIFSCDNKNIYAELLF